jgi:sialic acid synthase SpsE
MTFDLIETMHIGPYSVGQGHPVFIICEIGATHAGDEERAIKMIEVAAQCGAQAVKLQTVNPDYSYCKGTLSHEIFQTLQLPVEAMARMKKCADSLKLVMFTTPGDFPSLDVAKKLGFDLIKISSGLMTNKPLVEAAAHCGKPMIISSGMAYLDELARSVRFARSAGAPAVAALHCTSSYPCPDGILNLRAIPAMQDALGIPVGFSDHSPDALACSAAVALGARILEKHMALSHELAGPEAGTACDPDEFKRMVEQVRRVEQMRGTGIKAPAPQEMEGRLLNRRTIIAVTAIPSGGEITAENVSMMRGTKEHVGLSPEMFDQIVGLRAARDIKENEPIRIGMLSE